MIARCALWSPCLRRRLLFPKFLMGFCYDWAYKMCMQNLNFVALPVPKKWTFVRMDPQNVLAKFEIRSFSRSWDNRGYPQKLSSPWICPRSLFSKIFNGLPLFFGWTLWMYWPNLKSVAFPIPEIIGGTLKVWAVPSFLFSKIFHALLFGWTHLKWVQRRKKVV